MRRPRTAPRDYVEQTYGSPYWLIRYPHRRRYSLTLAAIDRFRPASLLDYGAGDGHLLAELATMNDALPGSVVAYEPIAETARLTRERLAAVPSHGRFAVVESLSELKGRTFEMITCLGVLEHMPLPERERFYHLCARQLVPGGSCLIDVPVEVGPSVGLKEAARVALKGRRLRYGRRDLARVLLGGVDFDPNRFTTDTSATWIQDHTGFDYRLFERELAARFEIVERFCSPFRNFPPWLFNQEAFYLVTPHRSAPAPMADQRTAQIT